MNLFESITPLNFEETSSFYNNTSSKFLQKPSDTISLSSDILDSHSTEGTYSISHTPLDFDSDLELDLSKGFENDENCISQIIKKPIYTTSSSSKLKKKKAITNDRFIPNRKVSKLDIAFTAAHQVEDTNLKNKRKNAAENNPDKVENIQSIADLYKTIVIGYECDRPTTKYTSFQNKNILRYKCEPIINNIIQNFTCNPLGDLDDFNSDSQKIKRKILKVPFKVLDAPALQDDFYLNLIDWSQQNILAVGLASCVYLWSADTSKVTKLCDLGINDTITSVAWAPKGSYLSVGTNSGEVQIWDSVKLKKVRVMTGHNARIGTLAWNSSTLASGSRDKNIYYRDVRSATNYVSKLTGHKQEVCGLKWSFDEQQLCSGGNDN